MTHATRPLVALLLLVPLTVVASRPVGAAEVDRAAGPTRVQTAVALSTVAFPAGSAEAVVIAAAGDHPDALTAAPLAAAAGAPVLLNPRHALHGDVRDEIERVLTDPSQGTAYLMGGTAAQSERVEDELRDLGLTVERIADDGAPDRFGTAAASARKAVELWGGDAGDRVLVALGTHADPHRAWPDALASGALAGQARWPILLVTSGTVPDVTNRTLAELGTEHATVVGGTAAITDATADDLDVETRDRIGGADRYDTSTRLADAAVDRGASRDTVVAATGRAFPDGLASGPAAYVLGGVTVLVGAGDLVDSAATKSWFERHAGAIEDVLVAGGTAAVSAETAGQIGFATSDVQLTFQEVASGLDQPVYVTSPPGDDRLFVVEQPGRIRIVPGAATFLDIRDRVVDDGTEQGFLGLAFHPDYADNGRFFVHYTSVARDGFASGHTRVEEYRRGEPDPVRPLLRVHFEQTNHNGGQLEFGPDGWLYLGLGDGGGSGDPDGDAQDTGTLLGAIVRIDPDGTGVTNHMHGLRNPYRFSIDAPDGLIYIGDVGQDRWEEVDVVPYTAAGTNFGWNEMEGNHCYPPGSSCDPDRYTPPVLEYPLNGTCAVTGGVVYRGSAIPEMRGQYLYADHCAGWVRGFHFHNGVVSDEREWFDTGGNPAGFGFGPDGEVHIALRGGSIVKVVRAGS